MRTYYFYPCHRIAGQDFRRTEADNDYMFLTLVYGILKRISPSFHYFLRKSTLGTMHSRRLSTNRLLLLPQTMCKTVEMDCYAYNSAQKRENHDEFE
jgi:hypothetical protein